jgi:hypothetical protein
MFAPYPYILGFSDNLFGAFPAYLVPRLLTGDPSLSMVVWWYIGWIANFVAAYLALRKLKPGASIDIDLPLQPSLAAKGGSIQVTLIQEGLTRATGVGIPPLTIGIND